MNKAQMVEELSGRFEGNKKQAQHALESVIDVIQRALVKGEKVAITGFGSFEKIDRAARTARNPATGASVKVKKTSVPKFRPGADLKAVVSGAKKLPKAAAGSAGIGRRASGAAKSAAAPTSAGGTRTTTKRAAAGRTSATSAGTTTAAKKSAARTSKASSAAPATAAAKKSSAKQATGTTAATRSTTGTTTAKRAPAKRAAKKA